MSYSSLFDVNGKTAFVPESRSGYYLAILNSKVVNHILSIINPTLSYQVGDICKIPIPENADNEKVINCARNNIRIEKDDWDAFETSWDFKKHPLV